MPTYDITVTLLPGAAIGRNVGPGVTLGLGASLLPGAAYAMRHWFARPAGEVLERLEWLTDVIPSFNGKEQRRALRLAPRRWLEFDVLLTDRQRRTLENALHAGQAQRWAVPVWMDAQALQADLAPGATVIPIDTTLRDFTVGGLVGIATDALTHEVRQISAKTDTQLTVAPLASGWPAGLTEVFPLRRALMPDAQTLSRFTGGASYGRVRFEIDEPCDWPLPASETTYRAAPVLNQVPNWSEDIEQGYQRFLARVDAGLGPAYTDDEAGAAHLLQSHRWLLDGRAQIDAFRRWAYARRGRHQAFWLPTFAQDFLPAATIGSSATTIDVEHCGYTREIAQAVGRRDIRIALASGAVHYRRITASTEVSAAVERLTIDSALGVAVAPADVQAISYAALARLEADAVEIAWRRHDLAEAALMTRASRNDL